MPLVLDPVSYRILPDPSCDDTTTTIIFIIIISVMELCHLLTRSGLAYPEVSSKVCHDSFCQLENSVSLPWVIYYEAFHLHVVSIFSCIPVICPKLVLFLIHLCLLSHMPLVLAPVSYRILPETKCDDTINLDLWVEAVGRLYAYITIV
jgi:hypothetical protein